MIIELRAKNCFSFEEQIIFSMKADMRNKKFSSNVHKENNFNIKLEYGKFPDRPYDSPGVWGDNTKIELIKHKYNN